jgi:hypothetical protein
MTTVPPPEGPPEVVDDSNKDHVAEGDAGNGGGGGAGGGAGDEGDAGGSPGGGGPGGGVPGSGGPGAPPAQAKEFVAAFKDIVPVMENFVTKVFGPLLAFVLGYYFGEKKVG